MPAFIDARETKADHTLSVKLYEQMLLIRRFEERVLEEFSKGHLVGTTHTCIGQEADAVGVMSAVDAQDIVFSNHRCHGHFIAYGGDIRKLAAEIMGKATGVCGGRGGSQHICWRSFYTNGVQGGIAPCATGMAVAEKEKGSGQIALVFLGDGTLGQGVVYESLNLASLWELPILFVIEDNRYAQTTPVDLALAGSIPGRMEAFDIEYVELDSTDVLEIRQHAAHLVEQVRQDVKPQALILHTYRFAPHSKGDDFRDPDEVDKFRDLDPLTVHGRRLSEAERQEAESACRDWIDEAFARASSDPAPRVDHLTPALESVS